MKRSPEMQRLDEILRSGRIVAGGFMGDDPRPVEEIIDADAADLARLGKTRGEVADLMREITERARPGLGTYVDVGGDLEAKVDDSRGQVVCPWPGEGRYFKTVTTARRKGNDETIHWSDLGSHMVGAHGFFEGKGSAFRIEPKEIVEMLF